MNILEIMYTKSATLLRDVFQYFISGALFLLLVFSADHQKYFQWMEIFKKEGIGIFISSIIIIIVAFIIGQILFSLSKILFFFYRKVWKLLPNNCIEKYNNKTKELSSYLKSIKGEEPANKVLENIPIHLFFEMKVFVNRPDLHARFIERYNVFMFMYRNLSTCLFLVCLLYFSFLLPRTVSSGIMEVILFSLSLVLFRQYTFIETGFLDRVLTSFLITEEKLQKNEK